MTCAEVIAIGDELTSGLRLDTNSQWLSERLGELGVRVLFHSTVGDDLAANVRVFREAFQRVDLVVCTGGLGPTADDLTRPALAEATGNELIQDDDALATIRAMFARRKREMPDRNVAQAMFPRGSSVVSNPHGTAPGIDLTVTGEGGASCRVFALPGVPAEMREMWHETLEPAICKMTGSEKVIRHRRIKCFGIGESDLEQMLPDLICRGREPSVGITVSRATITLRVTAAGDSVETCEQMMAPTLETIHDCLGDLVFGEEDDELQHAVIRLLQAQGKTLSVAEWGSGGLVAHWLSEADEDATSFRGGLVVRGGAIEEALFSAKPMKRLDRDTQERFIMETQAQQSRKQFETDYGLAIGAFPQSDADGGVPGQVVFAVAADGGTESHTSPFAGHPEILKPRAAKQALNLLRKRFLNPS
jgi:nicotinamide-nucleotide amidase